MSSSNLKLINKSVQPVRKIIKIFRLEAYLGAACRHFLRGLIAVCYVSCDFINNRRGLYQALINFRYSLWSIGHIGCYFFWGYGLFVNSRSNRCYGVIRIVNNTGLLVTVLEPVTNHALTKNKQLVKRRWRLCLPKNKSPAVLHFPKSIPTRVTTNGYVCPGRAFYVIYSNFTMSQNNNWICKKSKKPWKSK